MKKLLVLIPVITLIVIGLYFIATSTPNIRYYVDEFCSATRLRNEGLIGAQIAWWNSWTGRFSFIAFLDLFEYLGAWTVKFTPLIIFPLLVVSLIPLLGILLSSLFSVLVLVNAPNIIQSFYWQMGSINYMAPFIFLNIFLTLLLLRRRVPILFPFIILFVAGGFSETYAITQIVFVSILIIGVFLIKPKDDKGLMKILVSGLLGSLFSLGIMMLSPGTIARQGSVTKPESLIFVIKSTILGTKWYLLRLLSIKPFTYSLVILFSGIFLFGRKVRLANKTAYVVIGLSVLSTILVTMAVIFSGFYSMSILPPDRALFTAIYMVLISFLILFFALSGILRNIISKKRIGMFTWALIVVNFLVTLLLLRSVITDWTKIRSEIRAYAVSFDQIELVLKESKGKDIEIKNIKAVGGLDDFTDNKGWVSACLSGYYGLKSVKIVK